MIFYFLHSIVARDLRCKHAKLNAWILDSYNE